MTFNNSIFDLDNKFEYKSPLGNWLDNDDLNVILTKQTGSFVPLGIPAFDGTNEASTIKFGIEIEKNPADSISIEILQQNQVYYQEQITSPSQLSVGKHLWEWDGFDNQGIFNTV